MNDRSIEFYKLSPETAKLIIRDYKVINSWTSEVTAMYRCRHRCEHLKQVIWCGVKLAEWPGKTVSFLAITAILILCSVSGEGTITMLKLAGQTRQTRLVRTPLCLRRRNRLTQLLSR